MEGWDRLERARDHAQRLGHNFNVDNQRKYGFYMQTLHKTEN